MRLQWMALAGLMLTSLTLAVSLGPGVSLAGATIQGHQERTMLSMQLARLFPGVKIPPVDAAVPAHTETATFALG
jgi:hypothetical protein